MEIGPNNSIYQTKILNLYSFSNISYVHEKKPWLLKAFYNPQRFYAFTYRFVVHLLYA